MLIPIEVAVNNEVAVNLKLSDRAASKIKELAEKQGNDQLKLRVVISGGGCSGFQYGFEFDDKIEENDVSIEHNGATVVIDSMSYQVLIGSEIDYQNDLQGSQFIVNNPNAASTCGCGASFSV